MQWTNSDKEHTVSVTLDGQVYRCQPGKTVELPDVYSRPRESGVAGKVLPPVVKCLAPQLVAREELPPLPAIPAKRGVPGVEDLVAQGVAPGVAEIEAQRQARGAREKG